MKNFVRRWNLSDSIANGLQFRAIVCLLLLLVLAGFLLPVPLFAEPYAWVHFTRGDGIFHTTPHLENWMTSYVHSTKEYAGDVGVMSYTWGSNFGLINGFAGNSNAGLNSLDPEKVYVVGDIDPPGGLDNYLAAASEEIQQRTKFIDGEGRITHIKMVGQEDRSVIFGSANWTAGALSSQPNALMVLNIPSVANVFMEKVKSSWQGENFVNRDYQIHHEGPNGEEIEVYFYPDIYDQIPEKNLLGILDREINNAEESVFYHFNHMYLPGLVGSLVDAPEGVLVEGVQARGADWMLEELRDAHTSRQWDKTSAMHHKTMIFDMERIVFGSANHTASAMRYSPDYANQEVLVVIDDFRLARRFMGEHRRLMSLLDPDNQGPADSFDLTPPDPVTNLQAENVEGEDNRIRISWTPPSDPGDFSRYYIFASEEPIESQKDICDFEDSDNDALICEDPVGNVTGFAAGPDLSRLNFDDNDGDGYTDEDPWLFPEAQARAGSPSEVSEYTLTTLNYGNELPNNKDVWIAVVAIDKHGNESQAAFFGPVQSLPSEVGALPEFELRFDDDSSQSAGATGKIEVELTNREDAGRGIMEWSLETPSGSHAFEFLKDQSPLSGWDVSTEDTRITYTAATSGDILSPGDSLAFVVDVENPSSSGESEEMWAETVDVQNVTLENLKVGSLMILEPGVELGVQVHEVTDGTNIATEFDGSEVLRPEDLKFTLQFEAEPDTAEIYLHYRINEQPSGIEGGGDNVLKAASVGEENREFEAVVLEEEVGYKRDDEIRFLWRIGDILFDRSGRPFKFTVDDFVSSPADLTVVHAGLEINFSFKGIEDSDFREYRLYYTKEGDPDRGDPFVTEQDQQASSITAEGLTAGVTYTFTMSAVDNAGNESVFSNTVTATPRDLAAIEDIFVYNKDGSRIADQLDGSEEFQIEGLIIRVKFHEDVAGEVSAYYDIDRDPEGAGSTSETQKEIEATGSGDLWEMGISKTDPNFEPGAEVRFIIEVGDQLIGKGGTLDPFRFRFTEQIPRVDNLVVVDTTAGGVELGWDRPPQFNNFFSYRIFYRSAPETPTVESRSWGPKDDSKLVDQSSDRSRLKYLSPETEYRFRIAIVDRHGQIGALSNTVSAIPGRQEALLITELSPHTTTAWVEVTSENEGVNLSRYYLSNLDGDTIVLTDKKTRLNRGERAVLWFEAGESESDASGDVNGNGFVDLYLPSADGVIFEQEADQLLLVHENGDTSDAVVYRGEPSVDFDLNQQSNVDFLVGIGHWDTSESTGAINIYSLATTSRPVSLYRERWMEVGEFLNDGSKSDWRITGRPRPGRQAQALRITRVDMKDKVEAHTHFFSSHLQEFDGSGALKLSSYDLELRFNSHPGSDTGFFLWYDTAVDPVGFSDENIGRRVAIDGEYDPALRRLRGTVNLPGLVDSDMVRFAVSQLPDPDNPSQIDEWFLTSSGESFKFNIDNLGPPAPDKLQFNYTHRDGVIVSWDGVNFPESEFNSYRIYYDTGAVSRQSKFFDRRHIESLGDASTAIALLPLPSSSDTWNLRIGTVDRLGNGNEFVNMTDADVFSDTLGVLRLPPLKVERMRSAPQSLIEFDGSEPQPGETVTIQVRFDRETVSPVIYWNKDAEDTVPGRGVAGSDSQQLVQVGERDYSARIPPGTDDQLVQFVFETDGGRLPSVSSAYAYHIDTQAVPAIAGFQADTIQQQIIGKRITSLAVKWDALSEGVNDFQEYRILYNKGDTVSLDSESVGAEKYSYLGDRRTSIAIVDGFESQQEYTLGIYWLDHVGNRSVMSDTVTLITKDGEPVEDPAFDGKYWATELDGSEYLRKADIEITFDFSSQPSDPENVWLHYSFGSDPAENPDGVTAMRQSGDDPLRFFGDIPESEKMTDETVVSYFVKYDIWRYMRDDGEYFQFKINEFPPPPISGLDVYDDGNRFYVSWNALSSNDDFTEYRIRYRRHEEKEWSYFDSRDNVDMADYRTAIISLPGIDPEANYLVNITAVDKMGLTGYGGDDFKVQRTENFAPVVEISPEDKIVVNSAEEKRFKIYIEDLAGQPWGAQQVTVKIDRGEGLLNGQSGPVTLQSDGSGELGFDYRAGESVDRFTRLDLQFEEETIADRKIYIYVIEGEKQDKKTTLHFFE